jgi:hypothetical protein
MLALLYTYRPAELRPKAEGLTAGRRHASSASTDRPPQTGEKA